MNFLVYFVIIIVGMLCLCSKRKHFLLMLLILEFMVLGIFSYIFMIMESTYYFFSLLYLTITACEGALGLSILIFMSRSMGSDDMMFFNNF